MLSKAHPPLVYYIRVYIIVKPKILSFQKQKTKCFVQAFPTLLLA